MNKHSLQILIGVVSLVAILSLNVGAEEAFSGSALSPAPPAKTAYTSQQLDQLVAPIALYSDPLVAQILMAATYPLEVVEAARWLQNPTNAALHGDQLTTAMQDQRWDPSVKALVAVPEVLKMMDGNLQWLEHLGDAFILQQAEVMDAIQRLRQMALNAGTLRSTPPQTVTSQDGIVTIEPTNPEVIYVPTYNPTFVYGPWPYPDYPPYYFPIGPIIAGPIIDFRISTVVVRDSFFFHHVDFRKHRIIIDDHRFRFLNRGHPPIRSGIFAHDPVHRRNVPHLAAQLRGRERGQLTVPAAQRPFRGFGEERIGNTPGVQSRVVSPAQQGATVRSPATTRGHRVEPMRTPDRGHGFNRGERQRVDAAHLRNTPQLRERERGQMTAPTVQRPLTRGPRVEPMRTPDRGHAFNRGEGPRVQPFEVRRPPAPVFESHGRGPDTRSQSIRGRSSRSEIVIPRETGSFREMRGFSGSNRGFSGGDRGFSSGNRGFSGGDRGFSSGNRGFSGGNKSFSSGSRGGGENRGSGGGGSRGGGGGRNHFGGRGHR